MIFEKIKYFLISGSWYSGSSAVVDYLRDYSGVRTLHKEGWETRIFAGKYGIQNILKMVGSGNFDFVTLAPLYFLGITDSNFDSKMNSEFLKREGKEYSDLILNFSKNLLKLKASDEMSEESLTLCFQELYFSIYNMISKGELDSGVKAIIDNDPPIHLSNFDISSKVIPDCRKVLVYRDPRDQFVDGSNKNPLVNQREESFIQWQNKISISMQNMSTADLNSSCKVIRFEDFVLDESVRVDVRDFLGLKHNPYTLNSFNPEVSKGNIGIYKSVKDELILSRIKEIERLFPNLCYF